MILFAGIYLFMPTKRIAHQTRSPRERLRRVTRHLSVIRPRDLASAGLSRAALRRLEHEGVVVRRARGLYVLADAKVSEHDTLTEVSARVPHGVICLLSALHFHGLTTQNPAEVWMAIDHKARTPVAPDLPLRIVRFSGLSRTAGIERHRINGVTVRVYTAAKTVADCFKFRNKIGLEIAIEALREYVREHRGTIDELWRYTTVCRVSNVMRPYLESATAGQL